MIKEIEAEKRKELRKLYELYIGNTDDRKINNLVEKICSFSGDPAFSKELNHAYKKAWEMIDKKLRVHEAKKIALSLKN